MNNRISIVGLGKLGLPLAAAFASKGFRVIGVDINPKVVESVGTCKPLTYEPRLEELLRENHTWLRATDNISSAVLLTTATIVMVATPSKDNGCFSLDHVLSVCQDIGNALKAKKHYHLVIIGSTVNPTDCEGPIWKTLEDASGKGVGKDFGLCHCPEFVALGNVLDGFINPDFVLIGASDMNAGSRATDIYRGLCGGEVPIVCTNLVNAEITKIAANCHTVLKTVFANQMAELCEAIPKADVDEVTGAIGLDSRASPEYLTGATAALGPCFGRDMKSLSCIARRHGVELPLIELADELNLWQIERLARMIAKHWHQIGAKTVGVLGLTYKAGVAVHEPSAGLMLIKKIRHVMDVVAYDPMISVEESVETPKELVEQADIVVVTTPWPKFKDIEFRAGQLIIDCWRCLDEDAIQKAGAEYVAIGRG